MASVPAPRLGEESAPRWEQLNLFEVDTPVLGAFRTLSGGKMPVRHRRRRDLIVIDR